MNGRVPYRPARHPRLGRKHECMPTHYSSGNYILLSAETKKHHFFFSGAGVVSTKSINLLKSDFLIGGRYDPNFALFL